MAAVNRALLEDLAEQVGVDPIYLEKDFVLTEIIHAYATGPYREDLILKGGQALRHIHGSARLSKDADYVARRRIEFDDLRGALVTQYPRLTVPQAPVGRSARGFKIRPIGYRGPLGRHDVVELKVSFREDLVLDPLRATYVSSFRDPFEVLVMDLNEMVAEKVRAIYQRGNPLDLFDLWFIFARPDLHVDQAVVTELIPRKFRPPLVSCGWDRVRLYVRAEEEAHTWDRALRDLVPEHPSFEEALAVVQKALRFLPR